MKNISILGATGSIGRNTLDLIQRERDKLKVVGLTGANNIDFLVIHYFFPFLNILTLIFVQLKSNYQSIHQEKYVYHYLIE